MPTLNQWRQLVQDALPEINQLPNVFGEVLRVWTFEGNPWEHFYSVASPPVLRAGYSAATKPAGFEEYDTWFLHSQFGIEVGWKYIASNPWLTFRYDSLTLTNRTGDSDYGWDWVV